MGLGIKPNSTKFEYGPAKPKAPKHLGQSEEGEKGVKGFHPWEGRHQMKERGFPERES